MQVLIEDGCYAEEDVLSAEIIRAAVLVFQNRLRFSLLETGEADVYVYVEPEEEEVVEVAVQKRKKVLVITRSLARQWAYLQSGAHDVLCLSDSSVLALQDGSPKEKGLVQQRIFEFIDGSVANFSTL